MFDWVSQTRIIQGRKNILRIRGELDRLNCKRAFIVTDAGVAGAGISAKVVESLGGRAVGVFDAVPQDTGFETIDDAFDAAKTKEADCVVSVGGGSVIDTAKVLCILLREGGAAANHAGLYVLKRRGAPHVCIPTTAGTGSEVTGVAVLLDRIQNKKVFYLSEHVAPDIAVLDPLMTLGLPPSLTASTGMDAMTHAIEASVSKAQNPLSTAMALRAAKLIRENLPKCVAEGSDLKVREIIQIAATMAGIAFSSAQVGLAHAIAHSIGAICGAAHGAACGIMLPHVMRFNAPSCASSMAELASAIGIERNGRSDEALAMIAADIIDNLLDEIGHKKRLSEVGVTESRIDEIAKLSMTDPAIFTNPRQVEGAGQIVEILRKAL